MDQAVHPDKRLEASAWAGWWRHGVFPVAVGGQGACRHQHAEPPAPRLAIWPTLFDTLPQSLIGHPQMLAHVGSAMAAHARIAPRCAQQPSRRAIRLHILRHRVSPSPVPACSQVNCMGVAVIGCRLQCQSARICHPPSPGYCRRFAKWPCPPPCADQCYSRRATYTATYRVRSAPRMAVRRGGRGRGFETLTAHHAPFAW